MADYWRSPLTGAEVAQTLLQYAEQQISIEPRSLDLDRGYAEFVRFFTPADYKDGTFAAHIDCMIVYVMTHKAWVPPRDEPYAVYSALLAGHDHDGEAKRALHDRKGDRSVHFAHVAVWLQQRVRSLRQPPVQTTPVPEDVRPVMEKYRKRVRERQETKYNAMWTELLEKSTLFKDLYTPPPPADWAPPPKPVAIPDIAPPPELLEAHELAVARLPPCLQRAWQHLKNDTGRRATNLWWQVFPEESGLKLIPKRERREWEAVTRAWVVIRTPHAASCQKLAETGRCPIALRDIEDLPAGARVSAAPALKELYERDDADPRVLCGQLCGRFTKNGETPRMWPGMFGAKKK